MHTDQRLFFSSFRAAKLLCKASKWTITNLKLHKMLYLIDLDYLKEKQMRLISDEFFEAWKYGPVLPDVYNRAKIFGVEPITADYWIVNLNSDTNQEKVGFLINAYDKYKHFTNTELIKRTHARYSAWYQKNKDKKEIISTKDMEEELRNLPNDTE